LEGYKPSLVKFLLAIALLLFGVGLAILLCDLDTYYRYGVHSNEVAAITEEGYIIAWPTGEAPWFAQVSIRSWVLLFWLMAAGVYSLRFCVGKPYHGVVWRGTE
jgi:hypothetical protein